MSCHYMLSYIVEIELPQDLFPQCNITICRFGEEEEGRGVVRCSVMTKGYVKGFPGKRGCLFPLACFCYNAATQMDS